MIANCRNAPRLAVTELTSARCRVTVTTCKMNNSCAGIGDANEATGYNILANIFRILSNIFWEISLWTLMR